MSGLGGKQTLAEAALLEANEETRDADELADDEALRDALFAMLSERLHGDDAIDAGSSLSLDQPRLAPLDDLS